jgi:MFS family permease
VIPDLAPSPTRLPFDGLGTLLIAVAIGAFSLALTFGQREGFIAPLPIALFTLAAAALLLFLLAEARVAAPILDVKLFANRPFSAGLAMSVLAFVSIGAMSFTLPFFLQLGLGLPIATVGLLMAISPVIGAITSPIGGALSDRFGPRWVSMIGLLGMALGGMLLARLDESTTVIAFALSVAPVGFGMALFSAANNSAVMNSVARERLGIASGLLSLARTLGQSTAIPIAAAVFALFALGHAGVVDHAALLGLPGSSLLRGTEIAFRVTAVAAILGAGVATWMLITERATKN